ncbi:hypothetical protein CBM2637_A210197 [Cupriavidus taiwanensis]|nr:hypothetical protein CBM2637_A210197 [Cupriavidus taiwanensis]
MVARRPAAPHRHLHAAAPAQRLGRALAERAPVFGAEASQVGKAPAQRGAGHRRQRRVVEQVLPYPVEPDRAQVGHRAQPAMLAEARIQAAQADPRDFRQQCRRQRGGGMRVDILLDHFHVARRQRLAMPLQRLRQAVRLQRQQRADHQLLELACRERMAGRFRRHRQHLRQILHQWIPAGAAPGHAELEAQRRVRAMPEIGGAHALQRAALDTHDELVVVRAPAHQQRIAGCQHRSAVGRRHDLLRAATDLRLAAERHLHQQEVSERPRVDCDIGAVGEPVQRHRAQRGVMHARRQAGSADIEPVWLEDPANRRTRLAEVGRGEHLPPGIVQQGVGQRRRRAGSWGQLQHGLAPLAWPRRWLASTAAGAGAPCAPHGPRNHYSGSTRSPLALR